MTIEADIEVGGSITAPAVLLHEICRKLAGDRVQFSMDSDLRMMKVGAGRSKFELQCLPPSDFPDMSYGSFSHTFTMPSADLKRILARTSFAMSGEETRYYLCGVFLHAAEITGDTKLRAVATDGHRLALCDVDCPNGAVGMPHIIIPRKTVGEIDKMLDLGKEVIVDVSDSKIRLQIAGTTMVSKLIDGTYPDYMRVIPSGKGNKVAIADTKIISAASDRVSTVSSDRGRAVKLSFAEGILNLIVANPDSGSAEDEVAIAYSGDPLEIGFNNRYLQDILSNIPSSKARIILEDAGSPALIRDEEGDSVTYVLMPMRI